MVTKRVVWLLASTVLLASGVSAQPYPSTKALQVLKAMFTQNGDFGFPPYTADPFTCSAVTERSTYYNTTSKTNMFCNGTAWAPLGVGGVISSGDLELRDPTRLAGESFTNPNLTAGTSWTRTADFALAADAATYTHATGAGTFQQTSAAGAIPWAAIGINGWFSFTYTTSAVTGTPVCAIPATFALASTPLTVAAGTYTVVFQAMATTVGPFSVSCTSGAAATVTFDTLSLKQINGGSLTVQGRYLAAPGTTSLPAYSFINAPSSGVFYSSNPTAYIGLAAGGANVRFDGLAFKPSSTDALTIGDSAVAWKEFYLVRSIQGAKSKSLTDAAAATPVIRVPIATSSYQAGEVIWNAQSTDATDFRTTAGRIRFAGVNKAGTLTCTVNVIGTDLTASSNANTLVCAWTNVVNTTNCDLSVTCTDNTAGSQTMTVNARANMPTTATLTFVP